MWTKCGQMWLNGACWSAWADWSEGPVSTLYDSMTPDPDLFNDLNLNARLDSNSCLHQYSKPLESNQ